MLGDYRYALTVTRKLFQGVHPRICSACGYSGKFKASGMPPRFDARCPQCKSLERHRLLFLAGQQRGLFDGIDSVLHVAPEKIVQEHVRKHCTDYVSLDLYSTAADVQEPLEKTSFADGRFGMVICCHVLEHVDDDRPAMEEMHRVLRPGGTLIAMVPIIEGWQSTYEDPEIASEEERNVHFGQGDHVRYYGRDFRSRLQKAGFDVTEHTAEGRDVIRYGLMPGEKVFIGAKRA